MGKTRNTGKLATQIQFDNSNNLVIGNSTSSSFNTSGSVNAIGGITGSIFGIGDPTSFSASISSNLVSIQSVTASNIARLSNLETKSASVDISISNINSVTASNIARLSNLETKSSSVDISVSSINTFTSSNGNASLNSKTGSYATTGSNTFFGTQTYSGSVYIANDLIVQGSSSIQYISASSVSIGTNIVQLNTANPSVRFAGLTMIDSGSVGGSGSFLYDSLQDEFIFIHRGNGTNVTSSHFVLGPETYDSLGNETYLTSNIIPKGTGKEHLIDSCIFDNGTTTCIKNNLIGTGTITGTNIYGSTEVCSAVGKFTTCIDITSVTTTGTALRINGDNLTTGTALSIVSNDGSVSHTGNLVEICNAFNAGATAKLMCLYQGDDGDGIYINMARGGVGLTVDGVGSGYSAIFNNGNVGIGSSTPGDLLHIEKCQAGGMGMIIRNSCGATSNTSMCSLISLQLVGAGQTGQLGVNLIAGKEGDYSSAGVRNAFFAIRTACGDNLYERMRITSDGRVGINVSPAASTIFHVQDNTARSAVYRLEPYTNAYESKLVISSRSSGDGGIRYGVGGGNDMNIFSYGTMRFNVGSGNISGNVTCERLNIDSNGIATFACTICAPNVDITGQIKRIDTIYLGGSLNGTGNVTAACYQIESAYALASGRTSVSKGGQYASSAYYVLLAAPQDVYVYYKLALIQSSYFCGYTRFVNSQDGSTRTGISQYSFDNGGTWTTLGTTSFGPGYGYAAGGVATPSGNYSGVVVFRAAFTSGAGNTLIGIDQLYFMSCGYGMYFINNLG